MEAPWDQIGFGALGDQSLGLQFCQEEDLSIFISLKLIPHTLHKEHVDAYNQDI